MKILFTALFLFSGYVFALVCNSTTAGTMQYVSGIMQFCNGTNSRNMARSVNYFGSGADGAVTISTDTQVCDATTDGPMCVMNYSSLTTNQGVSLST